MEETERQAAEALRVYDDAKRSIRMMDGLRTVSLYCLFQLTTYNLSLGYE